MKTPSEGCILHFNIHLAYSSQGREDVGCTVTQGQEGHPRNVLRQSEQMELL